MTTLSYLTHFTSLGTHSQSLHGALVPGLYFSKFALYMFLSFLMYCGSHMHIHACTHTCACVFSYSPIDKIHIDLTLIVPRANSVSPLEIAVANRLIHTSHKNCIVYLFL